jgi:uncharacterized protein (DUF2249 family)
LIEIKEGMEATPQNRCIPNASFTEDAFMTSSAATLTAIEVDVRAIAPRDRHPAIFRTFRGLRANESMELVNDHDPRPLYHQLQSEAPGAFSWDYLERGPEVWRVRITRLSASDADGSCCGGRCSGV